MANQGITTYSLTAQLNGTQPVSGSVVNVTNLSGTTALLGATGPAANGVPAGGTTGQLLAKNSNNNYDLVWESESSLGLGPATFTTNGTVKQTVYNVRDYGAVGDGITDDTTAFNAAITAASSSGGVVYASAATYAIAGVLALASSVSLTGDGYGTLLEVATGAKVYINSTSDVTISNLRIDLTNQQTGLTPGDKGIHILDATVTHLTNIWVLNAQSFGVFVDASSSSTTSDVWLTNSYLTGNGNNDVVGGGPSATTGVVQNVYIDSNTIIQDNTTNTNDSFAIDLVQAKGYSFVNNKTQGSIVFGSEADPHIDSAIRGNIIQPAIAATEGDINVTAKTSSPSHSQGISIVDNIITMGGIIFKGSGSAQANFWVISNNILLAVPNIGINATNGSNGLISNNVIDGSNQAVNLTSVQYTNITNNQITTASVGIKEFAGANTNTIANNYFHAVTTPLTAISLTDLVFGNNNAGVPLSSTFSSYTAVTSTYAALFSDSVIDCTSGTFTVTLPTAVSCIGRQYTIKNSGVGTITIATTSSQTIDGSTTQTIAVQYESLTMISDGSNWKLI